MYSFFKTLLINCFLPFPLFLCLMFIGVIFLWVPGKQKIGKIIVTAGLIFLFVFSLPFVPNQFLGQLERQYAHPMLTGHNESGFLNVKYVVVLAGGHVLDSNIPITSQFLNPGIVRCIEGIRLHNKLEGSKLVLSGGPGIDPVTDAELMAQLAVDLGVSRDNIILESKSLNTQDEAVYVKPIVGSEKFILVTSASHMARAMALFKKLGMNPIPAPTDHLVKNYDDHIPLFPSAANLMKSDTMIYEYLGLLKEKISGNI